jgi:hypothetical protein
MEYMIVGGNVIIDDNNKVIKTVCPKRRRHPERY